MKVYLIAVCAIIAFAFFAPISTFAADAAPATVKIEKISKEEQNIRKVDASCRKQASMAVKAQAMQYRIMHGERPSTAILLTDYTEFYATCLDRELGDFAQVIKYTKTK